MKKKVQNKNKKNKKVTKKLTAKKKSLKLVRKRWSVRKRTPSPYPHLITISYSRTNVFFLVADIKGHTKGWLSTGRLGFKNKDKTTYMAIVRVTELFWKKVWTLGIRTVFLRFKNVSKRSTRSAIKKGLRKIRRIYPLKYLGIFANLRVSFNGCRRKKKRRK